MSILQAVLGFFWRQVKIDWVLSYFCLFDFLILIDWQFYIEGWQYLHIQQCLSQLMSVPACRKFDSKKENILFTRKISVTLVAWKEKNWDFSQLTIWQSGHIFILLLKLKSYFNFYCAASMMSALEWFETNFESRKKIVIGLSFKF